MRPSPRLLVALLVGLALAGAGCRSGGGGLSFVPGMGAPAVEPPPTVREQVGQGRLPVYGASLYSAGQKIYKELRQEESLMAFLACQGEPDHVEVVEHPGAPKILLHYSRRGLAQTGIVEIVPSERGFYAARPIDPRRQGSGTPPPPRPQPKPAPKPVPKPPPPPPEPPSEPEPEPEPAPPPEASPVPEEEIPQPSPTPQQLDDCPIEPWRSDCRALCTGDAPPWEWCDYEG